VRLTLEAKKEIVSEVAAVAANAPSAIAVEYAGISVTELTKLRQAAREAGVYVRVVRNTLARRALENTKFECMRDSLTGPLLLAFSHNEPGSVAKVIRDFAKGHEKLVVKVIALDGRLLQPSDIVALASLPTKQQAISMLMGLMQAPVTMLVRTLAETHTKLVRTIAAVRDQKQAT
jgi:large subunit ribosomal protein L10